MKKVLVIAAHPDDEILGCAGTIAKHAQLGDIVTSVIFGEGLTSRDEVKVDQNSLDQLYEAAKLANKIIGVKNLFFEKLEDNSLDKFNRLKIVKIIEKYILDFEPDTIYTHHVGDVNIDHQILHHSTITAARPLPGSCVKKLLFFETPSSTEWQIKDSGQFFSPNYFVDINSTMDVKIKALEAYKIEMRDWPHPRSIESIKILSKWRGSIVGINNAEAFILGRAIIK